MAYAFKEAIDEIHRLKEEGYYIMLVSASVENYLVYVKDCLPFDHIIGTVIDEDYKLVGENNRHEQKVSNILAHFQEKIWSSITTTAFLTAIPFPQIALWWNWRKAATSLTTPLKPKATTIFTGPIHENNRLAINLPDGRFFILFYIIEYDALNQTDEFKSLWHKQKITPSSNDPFL